MFISYCSNDSKKYYKMLELPKIKRDPKLTEHLCKCRPFCKSRRRQFQGQLQKTSDELLVERKPPPPCKRRWPNKVYPNSPCPLLGRVKGITIKELNVIPERPLVRICQAPLDTTADTTYIKYAALARELGAWQAVKNSCTRPFCNCGNGCCPCSTKEYKPQDADRESSRRKDMRKFDARVKTDYQNMRIMYQ